MKTEMENKFAGEGTVLDATGNPVSGEGSVNEFNAATGTENDGAVGKPDGWKREAMAGGLGVILGAAGTYAATVSGKSAAGDADAEKTTDDASAQEDVAISSTDRDGMSFSEAFASARAELGSAGAFEWHGKLYSTFTAEEWNGMDKDARDGYTARIDWQPSEHTAHYAAHTTVHDDTRAQQNADASDLAATEQYGAADNDVQVVEQHNPQVEVLGVIHDADTGMNVGGMLVNGQEVMVLDVDQDNTFEYAVSDLNHDGYLQDNEVADISGQGLTVDALGGFTDPDDMFAGNDDVAADDMFIEA